MQISTPSQRHERPSSGSSNNETSQSDADPDAELREAYRTILRCIGEDPKRTGLLQTPARAAKALRVLTAGYSEDPHTVAGGALFKLDEPDGLASNVCRPCLPESSRDTGRGPLGMVMVKDITINSLCEHHLLPFYGKAHIAYLPGDAVLGISKLARIAEVYARRLQMQERLTQQISEALTDVAQARGAAVVIECAHMCMCSRGVKQAGATTLTSAMTGEFGTDAELRQQFYEQLNQRSSRL